MLYENIYTICDNNEKKLSNNVFHSSLAHLYNERNGKKQRGKSQYTFDLFVLKSKKKEEEDDQRKAKKKEET